MDVKSIAFPPLSIYCPRYKIRELSRAPQSSEQFVWLNRRYGETETQLSPSAIMPSTRADSSQNAVI